MSDLVVPRELWRNQVTDPDALVDDAVWLVDHMCHHIDTPDLGALDVLDFGCGWRFTQAFVNRGVPIKRYTGVDTDREIVDFLLAEVSDPRFEYFHLDAHNDRYNPAGKPLSQLTVRELDGRTFDLICLFSVFTHLAPDDYAAMLRLVRRYAKPGAGRLFFTLFINEETEGGHGYIDRLARGLRSSTDPAVHTALAAAAGAEPPDFRDADPSRPLWVALYSRRHAIELIEGTGWEVLSVSPPDRLLQHHIVCAPV